MLTSRPARILQTAVFLLLPLLIAFIWLPLLPEQAALSMAAARGQLVAQSPTVLDKTSFSPLWFGLLALPKALLVSLPPVATMISALGWGIVALQWSKRLHQIEQKWGATLLPLLLLVSPLLPATMATAVPWQLVAILLVTNTTLSQQWRAQTIALLLLPFLWSDWPAWLLAGWALSQRRHETGHVPGREAGLTAVLFIGGSSLSAGVWGRLVTLPVFELPVWQTALSHVLAESDFYVLALLLAVLAVAFSLHRSRSSLTGGMLLLGAVTLLVDAPLSTAVLLLAVLSALAEASAWLLARLQPRLAAISPKNAALAMTLLLAMPLFLAQGSSLWQRYQARPLAYADLLAQAGNLLASEIGDDTVVLAPASLADKITQSLWPFSAPASTPSWGVFMTALIEAPPQHIVSSNTLVWDRLMRTGWFQERYRPVQRF
ncbi:MAG: hypothetical protein GY943_00955, partial [Chloroflexi bacterium]|nr:hypothetical protein [Chloroflexota bacterium]